MASNTGDERNQRTGDRGGWGNGNERREQAPQTAMVRVDKVELEKRVGVVRDEGALAESARWLQQNTNLLTPITNAVIPAGFAVQISAIHVQNKEQETYPVKGGGNKRGIGKSLLNRIAAAAGVDWDVPNCVRLDDGSDPHYVYFQVAAFVQGMDGRKRPMVDFKELDLRDGSAASAELLAGTSGKAALANQRAHILSHASTKAKLRLIREATGMRHAYTEEELDRPFCAAKLVFTGDFHDAETNREVHKMIAAQTLGLSAQLFGAQGSAATARQLPSDTPVIELERPGQNAAAGAGAPRIAPGSIAPPPVGRSLEPAENAPRRVLDVPNDVAEDDDDAPDGDGPVTREQFERMNVDAQVRTLLEMAKVAQVEVAEDVCRRNSPNWRLTSFDRLVEMMEG